MNKFILLSFLFFLVSISVSLGQKRKMYVDNFIIKPQRIIMNENENENIKVISVLIPTESTNIHGITNEIAEENGINIRDAILRFAYFLDEADVIVAHNLNFDKRILEKEFERMGYPNCFNRPKGAHIVYDTMKEGKVMCNLVRITKRGYGFIKYPKLTELYNYLFKVKTNCVEYTNAHNAIFDVIMTLRCYLKMNDVKTNIDFDKLYRSYL